MPYPSTDDLAVLARVQGIALEPARLAQAQATHAAAHPATERLRALPLAFLDPVDEPAHALAFIATVERS